MIDLTPLDVRNKRGDFKKIMRGYDPPEVDVFLELVAERMEALVRENIQLRERTQTLQAQVDAQAGREQAVQDALVTAQELRADIQAQSQREAEHVLKEAEAEARRLLAEADAEVRSRLRGIERRLDQGQDALEDLERRRARFIKEYRSLLEREFDMVQVEEKRAPFEQRAVDLDLGSDRRAVSVTESATRQAVRDDVGEAPPAEEAVGATEDEDEAEAPPAPIEGKGSATDAETPAADSAAREPEPAVESIVDLAPAPEPAADEVGAEAAKPAPEAVASESVSAVADPVVAEIAEAPVAVEELQPERAQRPSAPPPAVGSEPSALELELMAGAADAGAGPGRSEVESLRDRFPDVPDLETVLAEAGVEEVQPPPAEEIAPPRAPGVNQDNLILFDPNQRERKR